jgi:hypothetical protein
MVDKFHLFFVFSPIPNEVVDQQDLADNYIKNMVYMIERADCENTSTIYLSRNNIKEYIEELDILNEILPFTGILNSTELIALLLQQIEPKYLNEELIQNDQPNSRYYRQLISASRTLTDGPKNLVKDLIEKTITSQSSVNEACFILNPGGGVADEEYITVIRGGSDERPVMATLDIIRDFTQLEECFYTNSQPRMYNHGDNRHIEGHGSYIPRKSPLIGGQTGKENARNLLSKALGDRKDRQYLVNFDNINNRYIRFEFEGQNPQNQFHGYHLVMPTTHEPDEKAVSQISKRIIKLLEYREYLSKQT